MKKILSVSIVLFAGITVLSATHLFSEEPATYDEYETLVAGIKDQISQDSASKGLDLLYYKVADTRLRQLAFLIDQNDISSGRLYMSVNSGLYDESLEYLDKALAATTSKETILDIYLLKFLIYKERFEKEKLEKIFDELAEKISAFSESRAERKAELARIAGKLNEKKLTNDALRLKLAYAAKADQLTAEEVMADIMADADELFARGEERQADILYNRYIKEGQAYIKKETMAPKVMAIAEKYFANDRFREARGYYEFYKENFPESNVIDYCDYRIALCLWREKDLKSTIAHLENFLENYKNSVWFDKAFEALATIYYTNYERSAALTSLTEMIDKYYRKNTGDYARVLLALLYYGDKDYDKALEELNKIGPSSVYSYSAEMISGDIADIKKGKAPSFGQASKDTEGIWEPGAAPELEVTPFEGKDKLECLYQDGALSVNVKPGSKIRFEAEKAEDLDKVAEYLQDREDASRLPKKISEGEGRDILSLVWTSDGGTFLDEKQSRSKVWQAPNEPGTYKVSLRAEDLGLVHQPDRGMRKDPSKEVNMIVIVKD